MHSYMHDSEPLGLFLQLTTWVILLQLMATGMLTEIEKDWKVELPTQVYTAEDDISKFWGKASGSAGERYLYEMQTEIDAKSKEIVATNESMEDLEADIAEESAELDRLFAMIDE